jgi:hypothetical protein
MSLDLLPICYTIDHYLQECWKIEYDQFDEIKWLTAPTGSCYSTYKLTFNICSFCDENNPEWDESWCDHDKSLYDEESNAKNLLSFLRLREQLMD